MRQGFVWLWGAALLVAQGCGDGSTGPTGDSEGKRLASQFEHLADSVDDAGYSPTADALRHAAEIVRLTGHATPVTLTIDGASRSFLAVTEQLDFPNLQCTWPGDSGIAPPPVDTVVVEPPEGGGGGSPSDTMLTSEDSVVTPPVPGGPGECTQVGTYSMRTLIAWEPEHMAEVVRIVADVGSNEVETKVPDVMTGLPTNPAANDAAAADSTTTPPDTAGGGGGSGGYPGFMGEYLVRELGSWYAVEGSQTNALENSGGACTADRASFDWAEFSCEAARFRFEFTMRAEPLRYPDQPIAEGEPSPGQVEGSHTLALAAASVDGVRLSVVAWTPPPPVPGPLPPDSVVAAR